jgi:hypothetical protein
VGDVQVVALPRGSLAALALQPVAAPASGGGGRSSSFGQLVRVRVQAVGLNFRDVLNVLGAYPGDPGAPGSDFAGLLVRPSGGDSGGAGGPGAAWRGGEAVFGLAAGAKVSKRYEPPNILDRQCEWAGRIFEEAEYEGEEEEEEEAAPPADEAGPLMRKHEQFAHGQPPEERARLLWEFVEQHGHLPWADPPWKRTISLFKRIGAMPAAGSAAVASLEQELAQSFARQRERRRLREEAELDGEEWDEEYDEEDDEEEDLPGRL